MSTLSVPLPVHLENFIESMVKRGVAANKAEVVRQALNNYAEEQAVAMVLKAEQEIKDGKILRGDIRKLMKQLS
jgi:Arc/MetJ-type ribon-helix-helix transcriptional regulator